MTASRSRKRKENRSIPRRARDWLGALSEIDPKFRKLEPLFKLIEKDYSDPRIDALRMAPLKALSSLSPSVKPPSSNTTPGEMLQVDGMNVKELHKLMNFITKLQADINKRLDALAPAEEASADADSPNDHREGKEDPGGKNGPKTTKETTAGTEKVH